MKSIQDIKTLFQQRWQFMLSLLLFVILFISVFLLTGALENSARFQHVYSILLLISSCGLVIILVLISMNIFDLFQQVKTGQAGARLTVRMVILFISLTSAPVLTVYYFSLEFLHQRLDNTFDEQLDNALNDALALSQLALRGSMQDALKKTKNMVANLQQTPDELAVLELDSLRINSHASELSLLKSNGQLTAFSTDSKRLLPNRPDASLLLGLKTGAEQMTLKPIKDLGLYIQVLIKYATHSASKSLIQGSTSHLLVALYPAPQHLSELATSIESNAEGYRHFTYLRDSLKFSFTLVLSLITFLSILGATWAAFFAARLLVNPIRNLAEGTRAVAAGDYGTQLPVDQADELGFLVQSFNEMSRRIRETRDQTNQIQILADARLAYLEVILERMSSGVLSLDTHFKLRTSNAAASRILGIDMTALRNTSLLDSCILYPNLKILCQAAQPHLSKNEGDWQEEVTLFGEKGRTVLICRGTRLPEQTGQHSGHVLVFDDMTSMLQAQRNTAWAEMARRLAHEIKNPLTPIRLSAERLRHKYLPTFPDKEAKTLDRMTHTIIEQVEAMKEMVNAFSDYARTPQINLRPLQLNTIVQEVLDLYQTGAAKLTRQMDTHLPEINADSSRLRQVLHNLLKNALESHPKQAHITITTRHRQKSPHSTGFDYVELRIEDNGTGIPEDKIDQIFEPYFTSKAKGTGLGLAIVKKIIEEHGGLIWMENRKEGGTSAVMRFPYKTFETNIEIPVENEKLI